MVLGVSTGLAGGVRRPADEGVLDRADCEGERGDAGRSISIVDGVGDGVKRAAARPTGLAACSLARPLPFSAAVQPPEGLRSEFDGCDTGVKLLPREGVRGSGGGVSRGSGGTQRAGVHGRSEAADEATTEMMGGGGGEDQRKRYRCIATSRRTSPWRRRDQRGGSGERVGRDEGVREAAGEAVASASSRLPVGKLPRPTLGLRRRRLPLRRASGLDGGFLRIRGRDDVVVVVIIDGSVETGGQRWRGLLG